MTDEQLMFKDKLMAHSAAGPGCDAIKTREKCADAELGASSECCLG